MKNKKKKRQGLAALVLWIVFILMIAGITFISFQNGEATKELGSQIMDKLTRFQAVPEVSTGEEMAAATYGMRQSGRALVFLLIGIVGTITIHVSCYRCNWLIRTGITVFILAAIAYFTEKLKIYIPTRHYSYEEMMISMAAAGVGCLAVSLIMLLGRILKSLSHPKATGHSL
ncbi:MAG: hypothetical protein K2H52_09910 [Lachnospiraceae bacterium]|nr:hypothetical protein [Lachnospiraceae bacterium]MDE6185990.1 hypothetical protein [Lachnospiraceae bacterium]MDE7287824.1 hypothetical protein [Lachnospiraceae bacterium]